MAEPFMPIIEMDDDTELKTTWGVLRKQYDEIKLLRSALTSILNSCNSAPAPSYGSLAEVAQRALERRNA